MDIYMSLIVRVYLHFTSAQRAQIESYT